jgi:hypothetical protein
MVISSIAKLLMAVISSMPIMNSFAFDIGLLSKDNYTGGIDTNSLFGCFGAAVTCVNENKDNNNVIAINGGVTPPSVETAQLLVTKNLKCSC